MALPIFAAMQARFPNAEFVGFDPVVPARDIASLKLTPCGTLEDAFEGSHLVVIANNHPMFESMAIETFCSSLARPAIVYDFWNHFVGRPLNLPPRVTYVALGSHHRGVPSR